jgi:tetratricopeptide (TPR) repeat protein
MVHMKGKKVLYFCWLLIFVIHFCRVSGQNASDSIRRELAKAGDDDVARRVHLLNLLADLLNKDSTNQALEYAHEAYLLTLDNKIPDQKGKALFNLASGYLYNDFYDQALQYAYDALKIFDTLQMKEEVADTYALLGWIYYDAQDLDLTLRYHHKAFDLFRQLGNAEKCNTLLNAFGLVYEQKGENKKAQDYFKQALSGALHQKDSHLLAAIYNNLGICENSNANYPAAIDYFRAALNVPGNFREDPLVSAETINQMAYSYLKLHQYPRSAALLDSARVLIDHSTSNTKKEKLLDNFSIYSRLNEAQGDYRQALDNLRQSIDIRDSLLSAGKTNALLSLTLKQETQQKEDQINTLSAEKQLRSLQLKALIVGIGLILIIGVLIIGRLRVHQRKEKEIAGIRQALIAKELENAVLEKEALESKLEFKHAEMKNYALFISQRNEFVRHFIEQLSVIEKTTSPDTASRLAKLIHQFQYDLEINKDTEEFNVNVDAAYKDFFYNLLNRYPDLTENERRLCAQVRLNLSIKEIASLNNISVKSAEMARYRLRKQFNLQQGDSLNDFLKNF